MSIKIKVKAWHSVSVVDKTYLYPLYLCWEGTAQRRWKIYGKKQLRKHSRKWNSDLRLAVDNYVRGRQRLKLTSNMGELSPDRVRDGFVIGKSDKDFLYLDMKDGYSVWVYYYESGTLQRLEDSFDGWLKNTRDTIGVYSRPQFMRQSADSEDS